MSNFKGEGAELPDFCNLRYLEIMVTRAEFRMINIHKRISFMLFILIVLLPACAMIDEYRTPPNRLIASWKYWENKTGPLILTFNKDFTFEVDGNGDGIKDIWGTYELLEDQITFRDDLPRINTDCYEAGLHQYDLVGEVLVFTVIADQCRPRKAVLSYPMTEL